MPADIQIHNIWVETRVTSRLVGVPFCPDLLRYEDIGAADNLRGRVVRAFFWLMRWWPDASSGGSAT